MKLLDAVIVELLEKIRERVDSDLSWKELALKTDIDASTLSRIRAGVRSATFDNVGQIIKAANNNRLGDVQPKDVWNLFSQVLATQAEKRKATDSFVAQGIDYLEAVTNLIPTLSEGDTYALITMEPPWEMTVPDFEGSVVDALDSNARFVYVVPAANIGSDDERPIGFEAHSVDVDGVALDQRLAHWRESLFQRNPSLGKSETNSNLKIIAVDRSDFMFLFAPSIKYVHLVRNKGNHGYEDQFKNTVSIESNLVNSFAEISAVQSASDNLSDRTFAELNTRTIRLIHRWLAELEAQE